MNNNEFKGRVSSELKYHGSNVIHFEPPMEMRMPGEVFVQIPQEVIPGVMDYYLISNYGRLWHKFNRTFFTYNMDTTGFYYRYFRLVNGGTKVERIHSVVKRTFDYQPGCESMIVRFADNNKSNMYIGNLEYASASETNYATRDRSYSDDIIHEICRRLEARDCIMSVIAQELDVPYTLVQAINGGYARRDISSQYHIETRKVPSTFTVEEINAICAFLQANKENYPVKIDRCRAAVAAIGKDPTDNRYIKAAKKILGKETYLDISSNYDI